MAKRKAARPTGRAASTKRPARSAKKRPAAARRAAKGAPKAGPKRAAPRARKAAPPRGKAKAKAVKKSAKPAAARTRTASAARSAPPSRPRSAPAARTKAAAPPRKAPALNRERRVVSDEDDQIIQESPPSSLDLDRSASAVRTGRRKLRERYNEHTETSPALTGGDVDADWESASSVGDEAPGGDNPTPDQDIVDDIGKAVGIEYQDNEELRGADKLEKRDKKRWELDPASSEDWDER